MVPTTVPVVQLGVLLKQSSQMLEPSPWAIASCYKEGLAGKSSHAHKLRLLVCTGSSTSPQWLYYVSGPVHMDVLIS